MSDLYRQSGVDAEKGDALVDWLHEDTNTQGRYGRVFDGIGGFAGLFEPKFGAMKHPLLVASTDGVGTKLLLGIDHEKLDGLGFDLVAMCVNDLYCIGASPLFFVDYYATGVLSESQFKSVLSSIRRALKECETPLLGGETAELPGLYKKGHFDLAGFVVGVVDRDHRLGAHLTREDDVLIALESSGLHSNGFSLVRRWLEKDASHQWISQLMQPTRIYQGVPELVERFGSQFHALANITGGGISGNLPRVIAKGLVPQIAFSSLPTPDWMRAFILEHTASLMDVEPVFNLGCGMIAVVDPSIEKPFSEACRQSGVGAHTIGRLVKREKEEDIQWL